MPNWFSEERMDIIKKVGQKLYYAAKNKEAF
jgi:hypothetical protein